VNRFSGYYIVIPRGDAIDQHTVKSESIVMSWEVFRRLRPIRGPRSLCAVLRLGCGERLPCPMRRTVTEYRSWKRAL